MSQPCSRTEETGKLDPKSAACQRMFDPTYDALTGLAVAKVAERLNTPVDALIDSAIGADWVATPPHHRATCVRVVDGDTCIMLIDLGMRVFTRSP